MQDRFKFRFYDKDKKIMIEENSDYEEIRTIYGRDEWWWCIEAAMPTMFEYFDEDEYRKKDFVIMQCTGLKDKNGKLIYEGDIVNQIYEDGTIYKCEVVYNNCSFQLKHIEDKNKNYINTPMYCYAINYLGHYTEKRLEVIGNIYQDSHLLGN